MTIFWIGQKDGGQISLPAASKRSDSSAPQAARGITGGSWTVVAAALE
jgi:hypothetical protein